MSFLTKEEIDSINFKFIGKEVKISKLAVFFNPEEIEIDDYSRIDPFCIISASNKGIRIGKYVHIAAYCSLQGNGKIELHDFSGLSSKVAIYASSDDYSGESLTNPCVPEHLKKVTSGDITIGRHVIIGFNTCIMPNVMLGDGSAVGAFSFVNRNIPKNVIASGVPAKIIKNRSEKLFELERELI
ncbi:MAG: acyltransferase [Crocinitomicaceae bacterium]|nr:acyltransferase [Crocinitomicaceae bacterium]